MALSKLKFFNSDASQTNYPQVFSASMPAGELPAATAIEFAFVAPFDLELDDNPVVLSVGTNLTHSDGEVTATLEKNGDGGTSMLATSPSILNDAGTGQRDTAATATGITVSAPSATLANKRASKGDLLFLTVSESGSGGAEVADVGAIVVYHRLNDKETDPTV